MGITPEARKELRDQIGSSAGEGFGTSWFNKSHRVDAKPEAQPEITQTGDVFNQPQLFEAKYVNQPSENIQSEADTHQSVEIATPIEQLPLFHLDTPFTFMAPGVDFYPRDLQVNHLV